MHVSDNADVTLGVKRITYAYTDTYDVRDVYLARYIERTRMRSFIDFTVHLCAYRTIGDARSLFKTLPGRGS